MGKAKKRENLLFPKREMGSEDKCNIEYETMVFRERAKRRKTSFAKREKEFEYECKNSISAVHRLETLLFREKRERREKSSFWERETFFINLSRFEKFYFYGGGPFSY